MLSPWTLRPSLAALSLVFMAPSTAAQSPAPHTAWQYWVTAGAGVASLLDAGSFPTTGARAIVAAGSIQHDHFVASARWSQVGASHPTWDIGLLAGVGSSTQKSVRGSIAGGLGRIQNAHGDSDVTVPVEFQFGWRLAPPVGVAAYAFASFGGPATFLGAALTIQLGKLR
jgi:hypothetical protein